MYKCSECFRPVGAMLDAKGKPELFKCPHSGRVAQAIAQVTLPRKPIKRNKMFEAEDISARATKRKVKDGN